MASPERTALRLAATAIPMRETVAGTEVLMVKRNPELTFGGMWTFPGGVLEAQDGPTPEVHDEDAQRWGAPPFLVAAANAAVRETAEETGLQVSTSTLAWYSHWIPPKSARVRFATWFFLAPETSGQLVLDERENTEARWLTASNALDAHAGGDLAMVAPTWCTLHDLRETRSIGELIDATITQGPRYYHTRVASGEGAKWLLWEGDAGYHTADLASEGARNRASIDAGFAVTERIQM